MIYVERYFDGLSVYDAREVAYFLSRYFKSSPFLEPDGRNIFAEVFDREPSDIVRNKTLQAITEIEAEFGRAAADFDDRMADTILNALADFETRLDGHLPENQSSDSSAFFSRFKK